MQTEIKAALELEGRAAVLSSQDGHLPATEGTKPGPPTQVLSSPLEPAHFGPVN